MPSVYEQRMLSGLSRALEASGTSKWLALWNISVVSKYCFPGPSIKSVRPTTFATYHPFISIVSLIEIFLEWPSWKKEGGRLLFFFLQIGSWFWMKFFICISIKKALKTKKAKYVIICRKNSDLNRIEKSNS